MPKIIKLLALVGCAVSILLVFISFSRLIGLVNTSDWRNMSNREAEEMVWEWQEQAVSDCARRGGNWVRIYSSSLCNLDLPVPPIPISNEEKNVRSVREVISLSVFALSLIFAAVLFVVLVISEVNKRHTKNLRPIDFLSD
jgi:hypothetical protein